MLLISIDNPLPSFTFRIPRTVDLSIPYTPSPPPPPHTHTHSHPHSPFQPRRFNCTRFKPIMLDYPATCVSSSATRFSLDVLDPLHLLSVKILNACLLGKMIRSAPGADPDVRVFKLVCNLDVPLLRPCPPMALTR